MTAKRMRYSMLSLPQLLLIKSARTLLSFLSIVRDRRSEALHEIEKDRLSDHFSKLDIYGMGCCECQWCCGSWPMSLQGHSLPSSKGCGTQRKFLMSEIRQTPHVSLTRARRRI